MSMSIMATRSAGASPGGGCLTNQLEPSTPISSPEKATKTTSRCSFALPPAIARATSSKVAVPDALSSAPRCGSCLPGASESRPPYPR